MKKHTHKWESSTNFENEDVCVIHGCYCYRKKDDKKLIFQRRINKDNRIEIYTEAGKIVRQFDWIEWLLT